MHSEHITVEIESITVPDSRRRAAGSVDALMESICTIGLINPITLTSDLVLVSGWHRTNCGRG